MIIYSLESFNEVVPQELVDEWKRTNEKVVLVSRNNTAYLAGLLRQLELPDAIMIGDNMVRIGIEQPPKFFQQCETYEEALGVVKHLLSSFDEDALPE